MRHIRTWVIFLYVLIDIVSLSLAFFVPYYNYYHLSHPEFKIHITIYAFWIALTCLLFYGSQLYFTLREITLWKETRRTIRSFAFSSLLVISLIFLIKAQSFPRSVVLTNVFLALLFLVSWRIAKRFLVQYLVSRGFNNQSVLIVGAGKMGADLAYRLKKKPQLGLRVVGFLDDRIAIGKLIHGFPILGSVTDFESVARRNFVNQVYVTIPSERTLVMKIGYLAKLLGISIQVIPDHYELESSNVQFHFIDEIPVLEYHGVYPNYWMLTVKRLMDLTASFFGLLILSPLFLCLAIAIKVDSRGPVFYRSRRWGMRGRLFDCFKFRSMIYNADDLRNQLKQMNSMMSGPIFKMKDDPRVTRMGRFMRRYSLDELPQLWNVFRGDMSLVGPRPLPEDERVDMHQLKYLNRLSIKPGLTCLWQIRGRSDIPFERWMKLDDYYIRNWSPQMDISILMKTLPAVFKAKGAY